MGFSAGAVASTRPPRCWTPRRAARGRICPLRRQKPGPRRAAGSEPRLGAGALSPPPAAVCCPDPRDPRGPRGWRRGRVQGSAPGRPAPHPRRHASPGRPRLAPRPARSAPAGRTSPGAPPSDPAGRQSPQRKETKIENETLPSGERPRRAALLFGGSGCSPSLGRTEAQLGTGPGLPSCSPCTPGRRPSKLWEAPPGPAVTFIDFLVI